eukprot:TRINITY_DN52953_c0_g1_i1.p2 TRINITY_DN52953_c0_g1~~TRINITY_DN52953_c0_g1_i1.p2  ORF type:complete len:120 (+),score=44.65 TRINITY_DN52953_c0_g1_i1:123-482(+)
MCIRDRYQRRVRADLLLEKTLKNPEQKGDLSQPEAKEQNEDSNKGIKKKKSKVEDTERLIEEKKEKSSEEAKPVPAKSVKKDNSKDDNPASQTEQHLGCLLYTSPSPRDLSTSRMPSSA